MILAVIIKYQNRFPLTAARRRPRRRDSLRGGVSEAFGECHTTSRPLSLLGKEGEVRLVIAVRKWVYLVFFSPCSFLPALRRSIGEGEQAGKDVEERRRCDGGENELMRWSCRRSHRAGPPPRLIMTRLSKYRRRLSSLKHLQLGKIKAN